MEKDLSLRDRINIVLDKIKQERRHPQGEWNQDPGWVGGFYPEGRETEIVLFEPPPTEGIDK